MIASPKDLQSLHARYVLTPWTQSGGPPPPVIVRGEGIYLYDAEGKRYADLTSGLIAVNLGHGYPSVVQAMHEQVDRLCFSPPSWFNDARAELGEALSRIAPWGDEGCRAFFTVGGADATEDAVKFARALTARTKVFSAYRSFHGSAATAATLTGENRRWYNEPTSAVAGVVHVWTPYPYRSPFFTDDPVEETARALAYLRDTIEAENASSVAAIMLESVIGSNGVIVFPPGYLAGVRALCDEYGILLILDEVMSGFGRVGAAFAAERFGVVPDLITFAKGVTSGYVPLGGVLVRERLAKAFDSRPVPGGHTYSGHPLAMATGLATVRAYLRDGIFGRAAAREARDRRRRARRRCLLRARVRQRPRQTHAARPVAGEERRDHADALRRPEQARRLRLRPLQRLAHRPTADRRGRSARRVRRRDRRCDRRPRKGARREVALAG